MKGLFLRSMGVLVLGFSLVAMLSCAHDQQLVGITIRPEVENFGSSEQGHYRPSYLEFEHSKHGDRHLYRLVISRRFCLRKRSGFGNSNDKSQRRESAFVRGNHKQFYDSKCRLPEHHGADTDSGLFGHRYRKHKQFAAGP